MTNNLRTKTNFSKSQLLVFLLVFSLIGYLIFRALAAPNPNLPGDLNNDNTVNITDLSILLSNYGTSNSTADINGDGTVNVLDMSILLSNYGKTYTPSSTIPASTTAHTIDGNLSEGDWNISTAVSKCVLGTCNNTATYGALWDNTYLYVGVKVLDSSLKNDSTNCWDDDSVEVYIDPTNAGGTTYTSQDRQIVKRYNDPNLCAGVGSNSGVLHGWAAISGGYSVELAIPWSNLGVTPASGKTIGFDVGINDDDDGTTRDSQLMYNGTAANSTDPSNFAHLSLTGTPPTAPTVSLSASPTSITAGASSTLTWTSANASSCSASWTTSKATSGSQSVTPTSTTSYAISCTGTGGTANASTTVSVSGGSTAMRIGVIANVAGYGAPMQTNVLNIGAKLIREDRGDYAVSWATSNGITEDCIIWLDPASAGSVCPIVELDNEPYDNGWSSGGGDVYSWARKALSAAQQIKAAHPSTKVLLPAGPTYANGNTTLPDGTTGDTILAINTGAPTIWNYIDGVAVHPYSQPNGPVPGRFPVLDKMRTSLSSIGHGSIPYYVTEIGWPTGGNNWPPAQTEQQQSDYIGQFIDAAQSRGDIKMIFVYQLQDWGPRDTDSEHYFGILNSDGTQKIAWGTVKQRIAASP